jgi:hypothetical protein
MMLALLSEIVRLIVKCTNRRKRRLSSKSSGTKSSADSTEMSKVEASTAAIRTDSRFKNFRGKDEKVFDHGNYKQYYGKRNQKGDQDSRFRWLP